MLRSRHRPLRPAPTARALPRALARAGAAALLLLLGAPAARTDPPGPAAVPGPLLSEVRTDAEGLATRLTAEAGDALARGDQALARERLAQALARAPDVLVPVPSVVELERGLAWPVRDVVEVLAAFLSPEERQRLDEARRAAVEPGLVARAARGDEEGLRLLCRAPALSAAATDALRTWAEVLRERGHATQAARAWARWLRLEPSAPEPERVRVSLRLVDALAEAGDVGALRGVLASTLAALTERVPIGAESLTVKERAEAQLMRALASRDLPEPEPGLPASLELLWRAPLSDPGLRGWRPLPGVVGPAAFVEGDALLVHAGRQVRCLDAFTGRLRWAYPPTLVGSDHAPEAKYQAHDLPLRFVTRAGGLVLAVLGDPCAAGTFRHAGQTIDVAGTARESRARLVALDADTGALRWLTGGAGERHPVLGDPHTCVSGPPRVRGTDVYVGFARRFGAAEHFAACLSLATGAPRWVSALGTGENGRDPGARAQPGRDDLVPVRAMPWGAAPSPSADEVLFAPNAGLAAGVEASDGRVRWVRALPRFSPDGSDETLLPLGRGHSGRNEPVRAPGVWVLAPMDTPALIGLESGTGLLRWQNAAFDDGPPWRDLLGLGPDRQGRPAVRVVGAAPALLDPSDGSLLGQGRPFALAVSGSGRAADLGAHAARAVAGALEASAWPSRPAEEPSLAPLNDPSVVGGDLLRAGDLWVVVSASTLSVFVDPARRDAALARAEQDPARLPEERQVARLRRLADAPAAELAQAGESVPRDAASLAVWADVLGRRLSAGSALTEPEVEAFEAAAAALPPAPRAEALHRLVQAHVAARRLPQAVALLTRWLDLEPALIPVALPALSTPGDPDGLEDPSTDQGLIRSDLVATDLLRRLRVEPEAAEALARREAAVAEAVGAALASGDRTALQALERRAAGTAALRRVREALLADAVAAGRFARAARLAADLRLDPPPDLPATLEARRAWAARWQLLEAGWLADAGDPAQARVLLADLVRWGPSGATDGQGRTASALAESLRLSTGFDVAPYARPARSLAAWPEGVPRERDDLRALTFLGTDGPGAGLQGGRLALSRGLTLEVWDAARQARVAALPGDDEGWLGGGLQDVATWLPERGVRVISLVAGQPADRSGVFVGDWITAWDGRPLTSSADLMARLARAKPGQPVEVDVRRGGQRVLATLTPGRRPVAEGGNVVERSRTYAGPDGALWVAVRTGLDRLDLAGAQRSPLWRWDGTGSVLRVVVQAGAAYAQVRRINEGDVVVALEATSGRELWRRPVDGAVVEVEATGSAVVLELDDPPRALVLDADDGSERALLPRAERVSDPRDRTRPRARTAAAGLGRLWLLRRGAWRHVDLDVADTTTMSLRPALRRAVPEDVPPLPPELSVGAVVAVPLDPEHVLVLAPDPASGERHTVMSLSRNQMFTGQDHQGGALNEESRVVVAGASVFVVRNDDSRSTGVTVMLFAEDRARPGTLLFVDRARGLLPNVRELVLQDLEVYPDGLLLTAMTQQVGPAGTYRRAVLWVPGNERGAERNSGHSPWEQDLRMPYRRGAVRCGEALVLPTDEGADLVPIAAAADR